MLNKLAFLKQLFKTDDMTWHSLVIVTIHALILILIFNSGIYNTEGNPDINRYFNYSVSIAHGQLPYRDFTVEYPPLALAFFTLPHLFAPTLQMYQYVFAVQILFFDLLGLFLISAPEVTSVTNNGGIFLPVRSFNPECLVTSDGRSVISCLVENCDYGIIEDADLRLQDLVEHVKTFSLHSITIKDMTKALGLTGNYAYVIWLKSEPKEEPNLGGE